MPLFSIIYHILLCNIVHYHTMLFSCKNQQKIPFYHEAMKFYRSKLWIEQSQNNPCFICAYIINNMYYFCILFTNILFFNIMTI